MFMHVFVFRALTSVEEMNEISLRCRRRCSRHLHFCFFDKRDSHDANNFTSPLPLAHYIYVKSEGRCSPRLLYLNMME